MALTTLQGQIVGYGTMISALTASTIAGSKLEPAPAGAAGVGIGLGASLAAIGVGIAPEGGPRRALFAGLTMAAMAVASLAVASPQRDGDTSAEDLRLVPGGTDLEVRDFAHQLLWLHNGPGVAPTLSNEDVPTDDATRARFVRGLIGAAGTDGVASAWAIADYLSSSIDNGDGRMSTGEIRTLVDRFT